MLLPKEAVLEWVVIALLAAMLVRWYSKYWPVWCGLGVAACGAAYFSAVMANRPPTYYALLEWLASIAAISNGVIAAAVGLLWVWSPAVARPPADKHTTRGTSPSENSES
jgi:hypothetical protein